MVFRSTLLATITGLLLGLAYTPPAQATPGADIVFVIDQSGSMWGQKDYRGIANDHSDFRRAALETALQRVVDRAKGTPDDFRVAVVEFATHSQITVPPTEFRYDPSAPNALDVLATTMSSRAGNWKTLGNVDNINDFLTDTPNALTEARRQLAAMQQLDRDPARKRVVILITDGRPYRHNALPSSVFAEAVEVTKLIREQDQAQIRVLGINDVGGLDAGYWQLGDGRHWADAIGPQNAKLIDPVSEKLTHAIANIMDELLGNGPTVPVYGNAFAIGPYESRLAVNVTLDTVATKLPELIVPDGRHIGPQPLGPAPATAGAVSLAYDLPNPPMGNYKVLFPKDAAGSQVTGQVTHSETHLRVSLVSTGALPEGRVSEVVLHPVGATDADNVSLLPNWPIEREQVTIRSEQGVSSVTTLPLQFRPPNSLVLRWKPANPGRYVITADVAYRSPSGARGMDLFAPGSGREAHVLVTAGLPFNLVPVETAATPLVVSPFGAQSVDLHFRLADGPSGPSISVASIFGAASGIANLRLLDPSGRWLPHSSAIAMWADHDQLAASVPIDVDWWSGGALRPHTLRTLSVVISVDTKRIVGRRIYGGIAIPPSSGLTRVRSLDRANTVAGYRVNSSGVMLWLLLGLGLLVLILLGLAAFALLYGSFVIRQEDSKRGRAVTLILYPTDGNALMGLSNKRIDLSYARSKKLDNTYELPVGARTERLQRLRVTRLPGDTAFASARLEYTIRGAKVPWKVEIRSGDGRSVKLPGLNDAWSATIDITQPISRRG